MDSFEDYLHGTINFEEDVDPEIFENFIETKGEGTHNYKIGVYLHICTQAARSTDDQLKLTEEFSRCQVAPRNIMASLLEKNLDCAVSKQIIYNAQTKMKKKRMEGRNTVEEFMELRRVAQNILYPVILLNLEGSIFRAPPTVITKGRCKTDSTKRDKSHWGAHTDCSCKNEKIK
ncbi:hypothetical protein M9H77_07061 [Catharanthus roseus]|uniref:Uncharacterized protein n=1 Tax=Catharanthus roseus TaxID=4058 RepID=A0ACC0BTW5_CATRO|nr:hypothetical protein M9H77_07061 [Catharanthus roseus]